MKKNRIYINAIFDCDGGVEDCKVTKTEFFGEGTLDYKITQVFSGDIKGLSKSDDSKEIKSALVARFSEDGYDVRVSIS